jgi:hypothetical protein
MKFNGLALERFRCSCRALLLASAAAWSLQLWRATDETGYLSLESPIEPIVQENGGATIDGL